MTSARDDISRPATFLIFAEMHIDLTEFETAVLKKIAAAAKTQHTECFAIGGFVRDKILGRPTKDIDIVSAGDGIALATETANNFQPKPQVVIFKTYGTAQIKVFPAAPPDISAGGLDRDLSSSILSLKHTFNESKLSPVELEFVGARKESYHPDSRNPEIKQGTLDDDRRRRDFTINAMSISLAENDFGSLHDPFNGLDDLENKIIRTPLAPDQTFSDDPLRMMRAIRFAAQLDFRIEENTYRAISENAERIKIITKERIAEELNKILMSSKPSVGFDLLFKTGLLQIIFPQMAALAGAEFVDGHGHKDNLYHTLQVIDNIAPTTDDIWLRWAAVLHDIAKPATKRFEDGHGWTFHGHEVVGGRMVPKIFAQLKLPQHESMKFVRKMVEMHLRPISLTKENITDSAIRRLLFDAGEDIDSLMKLCNADITSKNQKKVKRYLENFEVVRQRCAEVEESDHLRNWQPPITGEMIMAAFNLPPSKPVGMIKDAIRNAILDGVIPNEYEAAHTFMMERGREIIR